jgi:hypothetical protein
MAIVDTASTNPSNPNPKIAGNTHPLYDLFLPEWIKLRDVREGVGGFLDGTYLIPHPREWKDFTAVTPQVPTKKLIARRKIASYDNIAATIVDAKKAALFRETPARRLDGVKRLPRATTGTILDWWQGGAGQDDMDAQMSLYWDAAASFGHTFLYLEREPGTNRPYICAYSPLDVPDWLIDRQGRVIAVKFVEAMPRASLDDLALVTTYRYRIVDAESWSLTDADGRVIESAPHGMGRCPVEILYARRRTLLPTVGQSVLGDPKVHIDVYNLVSELRELLRIQTFSILNVPLGTGPEAMTIEAAKEMIGTETGTDNVLFSGLSAGYLTADTGNVTAYQQEIDRRLRTIYRTAAVQWEADARGVEAQGSLSLKREDMNQRLSQYADQLERVEYGLTDLWYRAVHGAELGPELFERDQPVIAYPDNFDLTPFDNVLKQAQAMLSLGMPIEFERALRKAVLPKMLPGLAPDRLAEIEAAIDAQKEPEPMPSLIPTARPVEPEPEEETTTAIQRLG